MSISKIHFQFCLFSFMRLFHYKSLLKKTKCSQTLGTLIIVHDLFYESFNKVKLIYFKTITLTLFLIRLKYFLFNLSCNILPLKLPLREKFIAIYVVSYL